VQEEAGLDRVRPLIGDLQQVVHSLPSAAAAAAGATNGGDGGGPEGAAEDEEVVDAEFTRE
jgi:molecular chaperone DnaK